MATAPRPGVAKRQAATQAAQRVLRITVKGETFSLCPENVPFHEQIAVRKACGGLPLSSFWGGGTVIAEDSLQVLFWLARRAGGEPSLSLQTVLAEWPSPLNPADFDIVLEDPTEDDTDPES
tara:strand:+ start:346 stop:711 length:366 start_codon:yes stop_codon:yes gene_type:complete